MYTMTPEITQYFNHSVCGLGPILCHMNCRRSGHGKRKRLGIVVMDFDFYTGDRGSIPAQGDSLAKWMNLHLGQPMPCEGNWVVSLRCWWSINLHSVYICENRLVSLFLLCNLHKVIQYTLSRKLASSWQFNHIEKKEKYFKLWYGWLCNINVPSGLNVA